MWRACPHKYVKFTIHGNNTAYENETHTYIRGKVTHISTIFTKVDTSCTLKTATHVLLRISISRVGGTGIYARPPYFFL